MVSNPSKYRWFRRKKGFPRTALKSTFYYSPLKESPEFTDLRECITWGLSRLKHDDDSYLIMQWRDGSWIDLATMELLCEWLDKKDLPEKTTREDIQRELAREVRESIGKNKSTSDS